MTAFISLFFFGIRETKNERRGAGGRRNEQCAERGITEFRSFRSFVRSLRIVFASFILRPFFRCSAFAVCCIFDVFVCAWVSRIFNCNTRRKEDILWATWECNWKRQNDRINLSSHRERIMKIFRFSSPPFAAIAFVVAKRNARMANMKTNAWMERNRLISFVGSASVSFFSLLISDVEHAKRKQSQRRNNVVRER